MSLALFLRAILTAADVSRSGGVEQTTTSKGPILLAFFAASWAPPKLFRKRLTNVLFTKGYVLKNVTYCGT